MRVLFGCLAILLGFVSISLAARYGYKGADTLVDGLISAVVFGAIALCAFLFDAAAVRLWFLGHRIGSAIVGLIAAAALIVTFTNSLGAIAGRADTTLAQRTRIVDARADDRREQARLEKALADLGRFTPTDEEAVKAAKRAADTATANRTVECDKRGPNCRARELDEQSAASHLAAVTAAKSTTDRARQLEAEIRTVRARLSAGESIGAPNPLGNALALLFGHAASVLTAWQQAIVAAVFELCLVGVMVIYELLGHGTPARVAVGATSADASESRPAMPIATLPTPMTKELRPLRGTRRKTRSNAKKDFASVKSFIRDQVFPADGNRVEMKALMHDYRVWCTQKGVAPIGLNEFLDEIENVCSRLGFEIEVGDDQRVYCVGVKLGIAMSEFELATGPH
jgi:hypothetical protein